MVARDFSAGQVWHSWALAGRGIMVSGTFEAAIAMDPVLLAGRGRYYMIVVPEDFARDTVVREGEGGRRWIDSLPDMVAALCGQWHLQIDGPVLHGYLAVVVPVRREEELCVLKVSWISEATANEAAALLAWGGRGAALLLEREPSVGALLLERLDYTRSLNDMRIEEAVGVAGRLLRRLAIPAPQGLPSLSAWAENTAQNLPERWEQYGRPMPRRLLDRARDLAAELAVTRKSNLLVNYDLHYADVLAGRREPWLVVDPMVMVGDPDIGVGPLLWRRLEEMEAQGGLGRYFNMLVDAAELDYDRARSWALVRCVDYWLWGLSVGLTYDPARCERITSWLYP